MSCEVVSDPEKDWTRWFGLMHEGPAQGTLIVGGDVVWSSADETLFMDVDEIVQRVKSVRTGA